MKMNTIEEREKRANKLKKKLVKDFCKYHNFDIDSEQASTIEHCLIMMRNELL